MTNLIDGYKTLLIITAFRVDCITWPDTFRVDWVLFLSQSPSTIRKYPNFYPPICNLYTSLYNNSSVTNLIAWERAVHPFLPSSHQPTSGVYLCICLFHTQTRENLDYNFPQIPGL